MKKKKIAVLHAQVPFMRGGAELLVENLTKQLNQRGFDAEIVSMPFKWYPNNALLDSYLMWRTVDLSESNGEKIDLVIALKAPTTAIRHPNKVIWLMHQHRVAYDLQDNVPVGGLNTIPGGYEAKQRIISMDNITLREVPHIYSISNNITNRLWHYNQIPSEPLYHPPSMEGRYYTDQYGDYILSVGRLDKNKRVDLLIRALKYCDKRVWAQIAGKGTEMEHLQQLAVDEGVADRVKFLGFVHDDKLLDLYANALAVCYPPVDEDYGYITLEAFLSKKPIITCNDSGGVLEFAENEKSAYIVNADAEEIGGCFYRLYCNKNIARNMGEAGYQNVKDISWDHVIDELTKTIR